MFEDDEEKFKKTDLSSNSSIEDETIMIPKESPVNWYILWQALELAGTNNSNTEALEKKIIPSILRRMGLKLSLTKIHSDYYSAL